MKLIILGYMKRKVKVQNDKMKRFVSWFSCYKCFNLSMRLEIIANLKVFKDQTGELMCTLSLSVIL